MDITVLNVGAMGTNCYIVSGLSGECVIVDPGDDAPLIDEAMRSRGMKPAGILLTHGHFDHIGAVGRLCELHDGLKVYAFENEDALLHDPALNCTKMIRRPASVDADFLLKNGEVFECGGVRFKVLATPGHTAGSACYLIEDEAVMFSGDTLFKGSMGRTDLPTGDQLQIFASLACLMTLPDETKVYPGHGPATTISDEKKDNPYVKM